MEQISVLMICLGMFTFLGCGISSVNSIEAKESETTANILGVLAFIGGICFILGFVLLCVKAYIL